MNSGKSVIDLRISWAKEEAEEAILKQRETEFSIALGKLMVLWDLSRRFEFLDESALSDFRVYMDSIIDRFYANGKDD